MSLFEYTDKDLKMFFNLGQMAVNLYTSEVKKINFSAYETSVGPENADFPFEAEIVTMRPGLWYALNLAASGKKKEKIIQTTKEIMNFVQSLGNFEISFLIVLPPGAQVPIHRHFRKNNTIAYCVPCDKKDGSLDLSIGEDTYIIKNGYLNFDSKEYHTATNNSSTTYWLYIFEDVALQKHPAVEIVEL